MHIKLLINCIGYPNYISHVGPIKQRW